VKTNRNRFCSVSCSSRWHYQNGFNLGFQKGHDNFDGAEKGWFTTERVEREKNINYKDGSRCNEGYPPEFKRMRKILLRRPGICIACGKVVKSQTANEHLVVHHIDEDIFNNKLNNLLVMCNSCHHILHRAKEKARRTTEVINGRTNGI